MQSSSACWIKSARLYFPAWGKWFWAFFVGEVLGIVGLLEQFTFLKGFPVWFWWAWILAGFLIGPLVAFHRMRMRLEIENTELQRKCATREPRVKLEGLLEEGRVLATFSSNRATAHQHSSNCRAWGLRVEDLLSFQWPSRVDEYRKIMQEGRTRDVYGMDFSSGIPEACAMLRELLMEATT